MTRQTKNHKANGETGNDSPAALGMDANISRRDFVEGLAMGTGAALLSAAAPAAIGNSATKQSPSTMRGMNGLGPEWTGPSGIGDYQGANADTHLEVNAAHEAIRNRQHDGLLKNASEDDEIFDVIIVGSGIAALTAAYKLHQRKPNIRMLMLENHAIFGGDARRNDFEVDGITLYGPQGPTGYRYHDEQDDFARELGLPEIIEYGEATGLSNNELNITYDNWTAMSGDRAQADCGYFYGSKMVLNPWADGFQHAPISDNVKRDLMALETRKEPPFRPEGDVDQWLDSMTYLDLLTKVYKADPGVVPYLEEGQKVGGNGLGADVYSAFLAKIMGQPGAKQFTSGEESFFNDWKGRHVVELPGGNASIARTILSRILPNVFQGKSWSDIWLNPINWNALDQPNQALRLRTRSTVTAVVHDQKPENSGGVVVSYLRDGKMFKVRAKSSIVATPQQIGKRICLDLPSTYQKSMEMFQQAPALVVNVAVRNWKFMEKLGISAARWMEGFGWFTCIRRSVLVDGKESMPLDPSKPAILTFYVGFDIPGVPYPQQATAARMRLFGMPYAEIELQLRQQLNNLFSSAGFDAKRDIAGIVANRQGHALIVSPPGTFFPLNGQAPRAKILRERYQRIALAHSDLTGAQDWFGAAAEGERAAHQILEVL
ncbi:MAG: NAD(P)-binding protein [Pseudomonadota bacterium]|nr:NAD(P)-binding protein [Pseudomonadota bacterium]